MRKFLMMLFGAFFTTIGMAQTNNFKSVDNAEFAKSIADGKTQIVDVRTAAEYKSGHIPGAVNMDVKGADFDTKSASLDKSRPVAVYCRSGARSKTAARKLAENGYQVIELDRGITNWNGEVKK